VPLDASHHGNPPPLHATSIAFIGCYTLAVGDVVFVQGLEVGCRIGVSADERRVARPLIIDVEAELDCRPAASSDDVHEAVDYAQLAATVAEVAAAREYHLVETLAEVLSATMLAAYPRIDAVRLRIAKRGAVASAAAVGVVMERRRQGAP